MTASVCSTAALARRPGRKQLPGATTRTCPDAHRARGSGLRSAACRLRGGGDQVPGCYRTHAEDDPAIGRPIEDRKLGRRTAEDATEAAQRKLSPRPGAQNRRERASHTPSGLGRLHGVGMGEAECCQRRPSPSGSAQGPQGRTVAQLQTFLQRAGSDRFFALWVLEATSGMRRCELAGARRDLLDLAAGTLEHRCHAGGRGRPRDRVGRQDGERSARAGPRPVHAGGLEGAAAWTTSTVRRR